MAGRWPTLKSASSLGVPHPYRSPHRPEGALRLLCVQGKDIGKRVFSGKSLLNGKLGLGMTLPTTRPAVETVWLEARIAA